VRAPRSAHGPTFQSASACSVHRKTETHADPRELLARHPDPRYYAPDHASALGIRRGHRLRRNSHDEGYPAVAIKGLAPGIVGSVPYDVDVDPSWFAQPKGHPGEDHEFCMPELAQDAENPAGPAY